MLILISGQSASGKSEYAEQCAMDLSRASGAALSYLAAMMPFGDEAKRRIERHRKLRAGKGFRTLERYTDLPGLLEDPETAAQLGGSVVLLECMSNLTANELYSEDLMQISDPEERVSEAAQRIMDGICALRDCCQDLVVVTLDVFSDGRVYDPETERFKALLGRVSREIAGLSDQVWQVYYGLPERVK